MSWPDLVPEFEPWISEVRGRLIPNQPLSEVTWFRVGGPAQLFYQPADETDLAFFLKHLPDEIKVTVIGLGSNLLIRDGGISGNAAYKYNTANAPAFTDRIQALISSLGSGQTFDSSTQLPSSGSVIDYAKNSISWLEALRQSASAEADYRSTVAQRATSSLSQNTGVNLDEEMTNLLDLERTFQASSRLINTVNDMLTTLLQSFS